MAKVTQTYVDDECTADDIIAYDVRCRSARGKLRKLGKPQRHPSKGFTGVG